MSIGSKSAERGGYLGMRPGRITFQLRPEESIGLYEETLSSLVELEGVLSKELSQQQVMDRY